MIKKIIVLFAMLCIPIAAYAEENYEQKLINEQTIQTRIDNVGVKLLNANKIPRRIIFVYNEAEKKSKLKLDTTMTSRQVIMFDNAYKSIENDDELAAFLAREIVLAAKSFDREFAGGLNTLQIKAAPKKYEIIADKLAVNFMVKAGYDPIGLITYLQKTAPQRRFDKFSNRNLTSKRLAIIYEYIYTKYPYYLANNKYFENEHYQNFLLTSVNNRKMLQQKIKNGSKEELHYE